MKQNNQKEDRRDFLKNIGFGLLGISVLSNFSFENFLGSKALAKELPDFKIEGKKDLIYHGEKPLTAPRNDKRKTSQRLDFRNRWRKHYQ